MSEHANEPQQLLKIPTGIKGFERISYGGLIHGRTTLLVGTSGSGKTLFCIETLFHNVTEHNRSAVFVTFEEKPQDIVQNVLSFGWDLEEFQRQGKIIFVDASLDWGIVGESGQYDLSGILVQIRQAVEEIKAELVIIDSLGALFLQYDNPGMIRRELLRLADMIRDMGLTGLMTAERIHEHGPITRYGIEDFVSDCVIILRHQLQEEKVRRTVQIYKLRGGAHAQDEYPFTIQEQGFQIMPLFSAKLTQASTMDRISFGNADLDAMAGGGLFHDSVILVSGPTGSGKTLLATTFAADVCRQGERCLFLGYEESRPQLMRNAHSWGIDFENWEREGLLRIISVYPESLGLEDHQYSIRKEIEEFAPKRLIVDSVSALERVGQMRNFREFVIGLTGFVKEKQICTLFTSSSPQLSGGDSVTDAHISTITDAILLLRYIQVGSSLKRGLVIIKMRGSQHDKDLHEFHIDGTGLHIGAPLRDPGNVLGLATAGS